MPSLCSTISMMLGVAINSDQRKRLTASPAMAMPVYSAAAPNTINRQLPSSKMPWLYSTISMMLGVAIDSDQRKRLTTSPAVVMLVYGAPSPNHQSQASFFENDLVVQYYFYDARSGHQFRSKKEVTASPVVAMPVYGAPAPNTINRQLPSSKMPWSCSSISMMLGVAINSDQRKRMTASPVVAMPVYGAPTPNAINRQLPS
ncbi:hypothetical protein AAC387_Pa03g2434 [Persea americana]